MLAEDKAAPRDLLARAMVRESAKTMAIDLVVEAREAHAAQAVAAHPRDWASAPASEAQLAWIADLGMEATRNGRPLTWTQASLMLDETGDTAFRWLREQGANAVQAQDVIDGARRSLTGQDVTESDRGAGEVPHALEALEERLQRERETHGGSPSRDRMLEAAQRWRRQLQPETSVDRGAELLEERLRQLEKSPERSRAQEEERRRLVDRRRFLRGAQAPDGAPPSAPPPAGPEKDRGRGRER